MPVIENICFFLVPEMKIIWYCLQISRNLISINMKFILASGNLLITALSLFPFEE